MGHPLKDFLKWFIKKVAVWYGKVLYKGGKFAKDKSVEAVSKRGSSDQESTARSIDRKPTVDDSEVDKEKEVGREF